MWAKLDDAFPDHPKVLELSDRAFRVIVTAWCYSARHLTDGRVPASSLTNAASRKAALELERAGLWVRVEDAYVIHDWDDWNPTAEDVQRRRKANRERQQRRRRGEDGRYE